MLKYTFLIFKPICSNLVFIYSCLVRRPVSMHLSNYLSNSNVDFVTTAVLGSILSTEQVKPKELGYTLVSQRKY